MEDLFKLQVSIPFDSLHVGRAVGLYGSPSIENRNFSDKGFLAHM